jgi:hypothetical protein
MVAEDLIIPFYLWIILIILNFMLGFIMLKKTFKIEIKTTKRYYTGVVLLFFTHGIARIIYFIHDFIYPTEQLWWNMGAYTGLITMIVFIAVVESTIYKKSKHFFTIFGVTGLILLSLDFIFQFNISRIIQYIVGLTIAFVMIFIYSYVTVKSDGIVRKAFLIMTIGIILFELGQIGHTPTAHEIAPWTVYASPLFMMAALILLYISMTLYILK